MGHLTHRKIIISESFLLIFPNGYERNQLFHKKRTVRKKSYQTLVKERLCTCNFYTNTVTNIKVVVVKIDSSAILYDNILYTLNLDDLNLPFD